MEILASAFEVITPWHWLGLALVLLGIEMMLGTYDLLWISAAAFGATLWAALPLPAGLSSWQAEAIVFCIAALVLLVLGRTVFSNLRSAVSDRPSLNQRGRSLVGKKAVAVTDFAAGEGRVKLGDTTWMALADQAAVITQGMEVTVQDTEGTVLKVSL
ncbi:NfeD family protein [Ponticaulis profundi]|uniref:NfeD family protein n=1 Tax=Ponticaulis profundi TaxID=2665222 RepID=A0ABW1S6F0_9PROT